MATHRHIVIEQSGNARTYKHVSTGGGGDKNEVPARPDRLRHGTGLISQIETAGQQLQDVAATSGHVIKNVALEVTGPSRDLQIESLELLGKGFGVELRSVVQREDRILANVFVPEHGLENFVKRFERYISDNLTKSGKPHHHDLVAGIDEIRLPILRSFWTDDHDLFPTDEDAPIWWEVWVQTRVTDQPDAAFSDFAHAVADSNLSVGSHTLRFPERLVFHVHGTAREWTRVFVPLLDRIAELRRAKELATEFLELDAGFQRELIDHLVSRLTSPPDTSPAVCVLDYGVSCEHSLLAPFLRVDDQHKIDPSWTVVDAQRHHGTEVAGLAIFGEELPELLRSNRKPITPHRLESVRILNAASPNPKETWGWVTQEGVALAEQRAPQRARIILLTATADDDGRNFGFPTAWSAAIDQSATGALDDTRRLYIVSAGNIETVATDPNYAYPTHNFDEHRIQDPAQSWNAITVGACTELIQIRHQDYAGHTPLAKQGELCPSSRTSVSWPDDDLPIKPDIVMEGGNFARSPQGSTHGIDDLSLLTTKGGLSVQPLTWMSDTSAAAAQAARFAAILQGDYPTLWPETIRGLLVHSATWTDGMIRQVPGNNKSDHERRLRCFGYGRPDLDRARFTLNNRVALIHEGIIQPFQLEGGSAKTKDYHLHDLPWPRDALSELRERHTRLRVTLSYFIDPNPTHRGWHGKFRYQSHGLRFKLRGPTESEAGFLRRVSSAEEWDREVRGNPTLSDTINWTLGSNRQTKGSLHSDWWDTTGSELAACGQLAVHPVTGWWKERPHLDRVHNMTRYALIVTLETEAVDVDLYTPIMNQISPTTEIDT